MTASFSVTGTAQPQGSIRITRHGDHFGVTSDNPKLKGWREALGWSVLAQLRRQQPAFTVGRGYPVELTIAVTLPRPKRGRDRDAAHVTRPDVDKLARGILDALTGILYHDDAQVWRLSICKRYVFFNAAELPSVSVEVTIDDHAYAAACAPHCPDRRGSDRTRPYLLRG